jgi:YHS domain-containing protein
MNKIALSLAVALTAALSLAQMGHGVSKNAKHVIACPVTGDKVDMDTATKKHMFADYKGNRYFFCCNDCPPMFKKNPAKYAKKPHVKTPVAHKH